DRPVAIALGHEARQQRARSNLSGPKLQAHCHPSLLDPLEQESAEYRTACRATTKSREPAAHIRQQHRTVSAKMVERHLEIAAIRFQGCNHKMFNRDLVVPVTDALGGCGF